MKNYPKHNGSPYDRGAADAYYHSQPRPHKWHDSLGRREELLTDPAEIEAYMAGYRGTPERKNWN